MIVRPILMPQVDWETWNTLRREGGLVPASKGVSVKDPASFINLQNPYEQRSCVLGFLVIIESRLIPRLVSLAPINIHQKAQYGSGDFGSETEYLLTGSVDVLKILVIQGSVRTQDVLVRRVSNCIHAFMCQAGMKALWEGYTKTALPDQTYCLDLRSR